MKNNLKSQEVMNINIDDCDIIVVDDYKDGTIRAGSSFSDFHNLPVVLKDKIDDFERLMSMEEATSNSNPMHYTDDGIDLYIFVMKRDSLWEYMESRNCTNYVTGV